MKSKEKRITQGANFSLIFMLCLIGFSFLGIFQTGYQLETDLFPASIVWQIISPIIFQGCVMTFILIISCLFQIAGKQKIALGINIIAVCLFSFLRDIYFLLLSP